MWWSRFGVAKLEQERTKRFLHSPSFAPPFPIPPLITSRGEAFMPNVTSLFHRAGQTLGRHLDRLRSTFDELRDRVRDAAVQAIGQSVAGAVRDSLRAFLEGVATRPPESCRRPRGHARRLPGSNTMGCSTILSMRIIIVSSRNIAAGMPTTISMNEPPPQPPQTEPAEEPVPVAGDRHWRSAVVPRPGICAGKPIASAP